MPNKIGERLFWYSDKHDFKVSPNSQINAL